MYSYLSTLSNMVAPKRLEFRAIIKPEHSLFLPAVSFVHFLEQSKIQQVGQLNWNSQLSSQWQNGVLQTCSAGLAFEKVDFVSKDHDKLTIMVYVLKANVRFLLRALRSFNDAVWEQSRVVLSGKGVIK